MKFPEVTHRNELEDVLIEARNNLAKLEVMIKKEAQLMLDDNVKRFRIARFFGVSDSTFSKIMNDKAGRKYNTIIDIAEGMIK